VFQVIDPRFARSSITSLALFSPLSSALHSICASSSLSSDLHDLNITVDIDDRYKSTTTHGSTRKQGVPFGPAVERYTYGLYLVLLVYIVQGDPLHYHGLIIILTSQRYRRFNCARNSTTPLMFSNRCLKPLRLVIPNGSISTNYQLCLITPGTALYSSGTALLYLLEISLHL
jgi:hypothetical protein